MYYPDETEMVLASLDNTLKTMDRMNIDWFVALVQMIMVCDPSFYIFLIWWVYAVHNLNFQAKKFFLQKMLLRISVSLDPNGDELFSRNYSKSKL